MKTVVIIGGGLGGLVSGAILAKEGFKVVVLEKNSTIGGGLQTFSRFGERFDTGMHVIGGMQEGGNIYRLCKYLGIIDKVLLRRVDAECADSLYFAEDKKRYNIKEGKEGFINSLAYYFPKERENIAAYVKAIYDISDNVDLFHLRPSKDSLFKRYPDDFLLSADAFVAKYINNPKLRSIVAYMNPLYGGRGDETPSFIHAIISTLYINGASRFVGGSSKFADLLVSIIESSGGEVIVGDKVEWIEVNDHHIDFVKTSKGREYHGQYYISDVHPCTLLELMPQKAFPKAYRDRLRSIPNSYSAFSVYIKFKPNTFPYINHSEYYMTRYADMWHFGEPHSFWPLGFLFMTPPEEQQSKYAKKALVTAPMLFQEVAKWENTVVGHRGKDYEQWKEQKTQQILRKVEEMHPGFMSCIEKVNASSPLTIRDFYGVKDGALSGYSKDYKNITLSQVPVFTKVDNLLLTGQNNNLHGFCGVSLTAINTAEAILGKDYILNKINNEEANE